MVASDTEYPVSSQVGNLDSSLGPEIKPGPGKVQSVTEVERDCSREHPTHPRTAFTELKKNIKIARKDVAMTRSSSHNHENFPRDVEILVPNVFH